MRAADLSRHDIANQASIAQTRLSHESIVWLGGGKMIANTVCTLSESKPLLPSANMGIQGIVGENVICPSMGPNRRASTIRCTIFKWLPCFYLTASATKYPWFQSVGARRPGHRATSLPLRLQTGRSKNSNELNREEENLHDSSGILRKFPSREEFESAFSIQDILSDTENSSASCMIYKHPTGVAEALQPSGESNVLHVAERRLNVSDDAMPHQCAFDTERTESIVSSGITGIAKLWLVSFLLGGFFLLQAGTRKKAKKRFDPKTGYDKKPGSKEQAEMGGIDLPSSSATGTLYQQSPTNGKQTNGRSDTNDTDSNICNGFTVKENVCGSKERPLSGGNLTGGDDNFDDTGRDGDKSKTPKASQLEGGGVAARRFACPFYKLDPQRYRLERACLGPGWSTVHRVKEHLSRRHSLPDFYCQRCYKRFGVETELIRHLRQDTPCIIRPQPPRYEGVSRDQMARLRGRKKAGGTRTEEKKWREMYKILFPDEVNIPSPYYESNSAPKPCVSNEIQSLERRLIDIVPRRIMEHFSSLRQDTLLPLDSMINQQINDVVTDGIREAFGQSYFAPARGSPAREHQHQSHTEISFGSDLRPALSFSFMHNDEPYYHNALIDSGITAQPRSLDLAFPQPIDADPLLALASESSSNNSPSSDYRSIGESSSPRQSRTNRDCSNYHHDANSAEDQL